MPVMKLLSSDARNVAAFAISSGLPIRPRGTADKRPVLNCSFCSSVSSRPSKIGVSIGPGLMALTRILRCFRSTVQVRAKERTAALVALYTKPANSLGCGHRGIQIDGTTATTAAILKQRKRLLHGEQKSFDVDAECFVEVGFGDFPQWRQFPNAGVGEQNVDAAVLPSFTVAYSSL